jgi:hypothetical protein
MENPLAKYMEAMIDRSPEQVATAQLIMTNGQMLSGALRRSETPGVYELGTVAKATKDTPGALRPGQEMVVTIAFTAEAVLQVVQFAGNAPEHKIIT